MGSYGKLTSTTTLCHLTLQVLSVISASCEKGNPASTMSYGAGAEVSTTRYHFLPVSGGTSKSRFSHSMLSMTWISTSPSNSSANPPKVKASTRQLGSYQPGL